MVIHPHATRIPSLAHHTRCVQILLTLSLFLGASHLPLLLVVFYIHVQRRVITIG